MEYVKYIDTPIGVLTIFANDVAVTKINWAKVNGEEFDSPLLKEAAKQFELYFAGKLKNFTLPLSPTGTKFQTAAWEQLKKIPYGKTVSYSEQAKNLGNLKAVRAVGGANGKNPLSIIVPCHRVIGKNGNLTGFAGGLKTKQFLLEHEAKYA